MTEQEGLGLLFAKLAKISGELGAVEKDAKHQQNYMYHSADAVMGALNPLLSKYQIVIIPSAANARSVTGADGLSRWVIDYAFTIADGETGAYFVANWTSEGIMSVGKDANTNIPKPDDKSMGKAHTYSLKYWLIQLFKISTKDTSDTDQNNQDASAGKSQQKTNQGKAQKPAQDKKSTNPDDHFGKKDNSASKTENWRDTLVVLTKPLYTNEHHQKNGLNAALQNKLIGANVPMNDMLAAIFFHRCAKNWGMSIPEVVKVLGFNPLQMELTQEAVRQAWHHMKDAMSQMPE